MSNFAFLQAEWPAVHEAAARAEAAVHSDPRTACFYARRTLELAVAWVYTSDESLHLPYQTNLSALLHEPSFKRAVGEAVFMKTQVITRHGNQAVHSHRAIQEADALTAVRELFHVGYWLASTYARGPRPAPGLAFDSAAIPQGAPSKKQNADQLQKLEASLRERDENLAVLLKDKSALDDELKRLRAEGAAAKKASSARTDTHDYSEARTRTDILDLMLKEAGWALLDKRDREVEVSGMPNNKGKGYVDYVLWGDDGKPLAVVEAKKTTKDPGIGQQQAKLYADCLEAQFGQRPVLFYTNGFEHWLWDDVSYAPRSVSGFFKKDELALMIQRRTSRTSLAAGTINPAIVERFDVNYPREKGVFARTIHHETTYAQSLIDAFSLADKAPHILISVDMLDTGIDVPEVVNLVFLKIVRSKTKFWQMVGRGTRLRPALFGPGRDKELFFLLDYCQNLEFFNQATKTTEGSLSDSLGKRLFKTRLELIGEIDHPASSSKAPPALDAASASLRGEVVALLNTEVAAMNVDNFVVRPKRRLVEKYAKPEAWAVLPLEARNELGHEVAGLPSELASEDEEAKRFDLLILKLQLAVLRAEPSFERLRDLVKSIAGALEEKAIIPMVKPHLPLLQEIQSEAWWEDVTTPMLEQARTALRALVKLLDKLSRTPIYTDFEDQIGEGAEVAMPDFGPKDSFARFLAKTRAFLKEHENDLAIYKVRMNKALTRADLDELERMLTTSGLGSAEDVQKAKETSHGLGLFVRSLVGLDREAAKLCFAGFLAGKTLGANQIEFVNMIVNHLTERGVMDGALLYESPFTDFTPRGPEGLFASAQVDELLAALLEVRAAALAA